MDNETGEIISQKSNVGQPKLMQIDELMNIEDVDEDTISENFSVLNVIGDISNTEKDLTELEGKTIDDFIFGVEDTNYGSKSTEKVSKEVPHFGNMIGFLRPASQAVQKTILENPKILPELLSMDFSDLLKMFQRIFVQSESIEEAYRTLFEGVSQLGLNKFIENYFQKENQLDRV